MSRPSNFRNISIVFVLAICIGGGLALTTPKPAMEPLAGTIPANVALAFESLKPAVVVSAAKNAASAHSGRFGKDA